MLASINIVFATKARVLNMIFGVWLYTVTSPSHSASALAPSPQPARIGKVKIRITYQLYFLIILFLWSLLKWESSDNNLWHLFIIDVDAIIESILGML